jgi:glutaconate CoA-transferase, subunit A
MGRTPMALNKQLTAAEVIGELRDGMTIGIGGWGARRKPMALVRELLRSSLRDLTIVSYGGPDVGMLCAAGKVRRLVFAFVSMDVIALEPYYRKARETGAIEVMEIDEGMFEWGLRAAAMRMSFLPIRAGLATDVLLRNPRIKTVRSPYDDAEEFVAMPALRLDAALLHVNEADCLGNLRLRGNDLFFDDLFARAAARCYVSAEKVCPQLSFDSRDARENPFERSLVSGVVAAPFGAHPTYFSPQYGWDLPHLQRYAESASTSEGWPRYVRDFVALTEEDYLGRVGGAGHIAQLPLPEF